jgi:PIN domain
MAINLLLDTNILRRLVSKGGVSELLRKLEFLVKRNYVTLLAPDALRTEWIKHKEEERNQIAKILGEKAEIRIRQLFEDFTDEFYRERLDDARQLLNSQLEMIDELLDKHTTTIPITSEVLFKIREQRTKAKMPFHDSGKDNMDDAEIIFSALDYLTNQKETELYFVSYNTDDFPLKIGQDDYILHPEITEVFPQVKVNYYTDIRHAFLALDNLGAPRYEKKTERRRDKIKNTILIDTSKPILEQIFDYIDKRFDKLYIIPKKLFVNHRPFILADTIEYSDTPFTLITDNEELFNFFTHITVVDGVVYSDVPGLIKSPEDEQKVKTVYRTLINNCLFNVAYKTEKETAIVYTEQVDTCNCPLCSYRRLDFVRILKQDTLPQPPDNPTLQTLRNAYGQYKIGNFYEAAKILQNLFEERKNKPDLLLYIIGFNLSHIAPFLRNLYFEEREVRKLGDELMGFDLETLYSSCKTDAKDKEIIDYIHHKLFIRHPFYSMYEKVNTITDHFYGQNTGFNDNTKQLMEDYQVVDAFLSQNSIIYDLYSEFDSLNHMFTQGLLASYGCNAYLGGKLEQFSDPTLEKLILSGNASRTEKYLFRFKLAQLKYAPSDNINTRITTIFENLLDNLELIIETYEAKAEHKIHFFWENLSDIIYSLLSIAGMLKLETNAVDSIARKSLPLLDKQDHIRYFDLLKHIRFFLVSKKDVLQPDILRSYFINAIKNSGFDSVSYFETLTSIINKRGIAVDLPDNEFEFVRQLFLDRNKTDDNSMKWQSINYIFSTITSEAQKKEISDYVDYALSVRFEQGKYYLASITDMLPGYKKYLDQYITEIERIVATGPLQRPFDRQDFYFDPRIDNFYNLYFRFNLPIPESIKSQIPTLGIYYEWLNDMDNFDYSKFNTKWLSTHFTKYFKWKFRQCLRLKQHLIDLIKEDLNTDLERRFFLIYSLDD